MESHHAVHHEFDKQHHNIHAEMEEMKATQEELERDLQEQRKVRVPPLLRRARRLLGRCAAPTDQQ